MTRTWSSRPRNHYFADLRNIRASDRIDATREPGRWIYPLADAEKPIVEARSPALRGPQETAASIANGVAQIETGAMRGNIPIVCGLTIVFDKSESWYRRSVVGQFNQVASMINHAREHLDQVQTLSHDRGKPLDPEQSKEILMTFIGRGFNGLIAEHERLAKEETRYVETLIAGGGRHVLRDLLASPFVGDDVKAQMRERRAEWDHDSSATTGLEIGNQGGLSI